MPKIAPYVIPSSGRGLVGLSLGFRAYSLRIDNLSNQWLQEASSLAWIPPYSLGVVLRLYGTSVALVQLRAPTGQPQLGPLSGEYAVAVYSDETRPEVAGVPVRDFQLVQAVTDLTLGPQPQLPITGVERLWADPTGVLHRLMSTGADYQLIDTGTTLGGVLAGTLPNPSLAAGAVGSSALAPGAAAANVGALGGVLAGTLPNPSHANIAHLFPQTVAATLGFIVPNGVPYYGTDSGGSARPFLTFTSDNYTGHHLGQAGTVFVDYQNTLRLGYLTLRSEDTKLGMGFGIVPNAQLDVVGVSGTGWGAFTNISASALAGHPGATLWLRSQDGGAGCGGTILIGAAQGMFAGIRGAFIDGTGNGRGNLLFATRTNPSDSALTERMAIYYNGDISFCAGAPAVSVTAGYPMMPKMGGPPTGIPADLHGGGWAPFVFDSGNRRLYIFDGSAWRFVALT